MGVPTMASMPAYLTCFALALLLSPAQSTYPTAYSTTFLSASTAPGQTGDHLPTFQDAMPLGNGDLAALVWANVSAGSLDYYLRKSDGQGMSGDTMVLTYGSFAVSPNPFSTGSYFNATLDLLASTFSVCGGGVNATHAGGCFTALVHASANELLVSFSSLDGTPRSLSATIRSVRPPLRSTYSLDWNCFSASSEADVFVDPLPPAFATGTVAMYHRNAATDTSLITTHLQQQHIEALLPHVHDPWSNNTFGVAVSGSCGGAALTRTSQATLACPSPALASSARVTALAAQAESAEAWLAALAAAAARPVPDAALHAAWWAGFWGRSYVEVTSAPMPVQAQRQQQQQQQAAPLLSPLSQTLVLHLDAHTLAAGGLSNGSAVAQWLDTSGTGSSAANGNATQQPLLLLQAAPLQAPGVLFDGLASNLQNPALALPAAGSTVVAVLVDGGTATTCCSGVFYARGSCRGLSTASGAPGAPGTSHLLADWCYGTDAHSAADIRGQPVVAAVVYAPSATLPGNSSAAAYLNGCLSSSDAAIPLAGSTGYIVGSRNVELGRYFRGVLHELLVYSGPLNASELAGLTAALSAKWGLPPPQPCPQPPLASGLSQKYALQRYIAATQSRAAWPLRFNGMLFMANMPPHADRRRWGILDCWQNTRLAYVPMLANGDGDLHAVLLDYMLQWVDLTRARSRLFFGIDGIFFTECKVPMGVPSSKHYDGSCDGSSRPANYPVGEPCYSSGNAFEYGGDGGTPEVALAALEHFYYTQDAAALQRHLPLATLAAAFYNQRYPRFPNGTLRIFPTGVLEYYWCKVNATTGQPSSDCCENDLPTVAGVTQMLEQLLTVLPPAASSPQERATWSTLLDAMPPLPMSNASGQSRLVPAAVLCSSGSNDVEDPELYAVHPYRRLTVGRRTALAAVAAGSSTAAPPLDLTPAINAFHADPRAYADNTDWNQGAFQAALLGLVPEAVRLLAERALASPAAGYRWPGFAGYYHDYSPSSELYAGLVTTTNFMLLQPGDDSRGTMALLPAWPCQWSVRFKLWGPLNTSLEGSYTAPAPGESKGVGQVTVTPKQREGAVVWVNCV